MNSTMSTIVGAFVASLIFFVGNMVTLFTENPELTFDAIKQATWVAALGGALLQFLKDYQAVWTRNMIDKAAGNKP